MDFPEIRCGFRPHLQIIFYILTADFRQNIGDMIFFMIVL